MMAFMNGMMLMAFCVAGMLFLRFWRRSHDRLFLMFSIAFWIMAVNRFMLTLVAQTHPEHEHQFWLYVVRLIAFAVILLAILDKNRRQSPVGHGPAAARH